MELYEQLNDVYVAWLESQGYEASEESQERFAEGFILETSNTGVEGYEELGAYVAEESGSAEDFWQQAGSHHLANYYKFDSFGFGRDLDWGGDVYSVELGDRTYWFWNNI